MSKRLVALVGLWAALGAGEPAAAVNIAFFNDGAFVDTTREAPNLQRCLADSLGHVVVPFTGTSDGEWASALAGADVLVIPELERDDLFAALPAEVQSRIRDFVELDGHGLVVSGDISSTPSHAVAFLNGIFSFSIEFGGEQALTTVFDSTAAAGTAYAGSIAQMAYADGQYEVVTASLPAGSRAIYTQGANTSVFALDVGEGRIDYLGFDWFTIAPPTDWTHALGSAVIHAANLPGHRIALFFDGAFVDSTAASGEAANLEATLVSLGHQVTRFVGTDAASWSAALGGAELCAIPELERADLAAALPVETRELLAQYVLSGGGLILSSDGASPRRSANLLKVVLGFPDVVIGSGGLVSSLNPAAAAGTPFAAGPVQLPASNAVRSIAGGLPGDAKVLYQNGANVFVFAASRGWGRIVHLGFDWFELPTPLGWRSAAQHAVTYCAGPRPFTLTAPPVNAGENAVVTADLSGFVGLTTAALRFRAGGDPTFLSVPLVQTATNAWSTIIPSASVGPKGVQFFLELGNGTGVGTSPLLASGTHTHNLPVTLSGFQAMSLPGGAYRLLGLQVQAANPAPTAVFDELGGYDIKKWRYGTFDGSAYREPGAGAANAVPGQGFWIVAKNGGNIATNGTSTDVSGHFLLTLRPGFNQIANPFNFPVDFADVERPADVEANLIAFDGSGYVNGVTTLQPGQGYWIRNNAAGNVTIAIPPLGAGVTARAPQAPVQLADGADWCLRIDAFAGAFADRGNLLGMREGATDGRDGYDLSEPPPAPEGWVRAGFASTDEGELFADWRPQDASGATWQVTFASDQHGAPFRIELEPERALPDGWDVAVFEGAREVELGAERVIAGTVGSTTAPRTFTVSVGSPTYLSRVRTESHASVTTFALGAPFPNPATVGVTVDLAVPQPVDDASVAVYDVQGRLVQTLLSGPVGQGVQRVAWDGRDATGLRAAAGVYFVKARAGELTANRKVVLLP